MRSIAELREEALTPAQLARRGELQLQKAALVSVERGRGESIPMTQVVTLRANGEREGGERMAANLQWHHRKGGKGPTTASTASTRVQRAQTRSRKRPSRARLIKSPKGGRKDGRGGAKCAIVLCLSIISLKNIEVL